MGYLIAYLLLTLTIHLLRELVNPAPGDGNAATVRRCLWNDSRFDCYSAKVSPATLRLDSVPRCSRSGFLTGKIQGCQKEVYPLQRPV